MDKKTIKFLLENLCDILGIGKGEAGFDGFFYRDQLEHNITKDYILQFLEKNSELNSFEIYKQLLLPLVIINPEKHQSIKWIYSTLAYACTDNNLKRHYYEMSFRHMLLLGLDGVNNTEDAIKFYAIVLTRESCCSQCKKYLDDKIYDFEEINI